MRAGPKVAIAAEPTEHRDRQPAASIIHELRVALFTRLNPSSHRLVQREVVLGEQREAEPGRTRACEARLAHAVGTQG